MADFAYGRVYVIEKNTGKNLEGVLVRWRLGDITKERITGADGVMLYMVENREYVVTVVPPEGWHCVGDCSVTGTHLMLPLTVVLETDDVPPRPEPPDGFLQFSDAEAKKVVLEAWRRVGEGLGQFDPENDTTLRFGMQSSLLGAPLTSRFTVKGDRDQDLMCRGFSGGIYVESSEFGSFGVVHWDSGQNYEPIDEGR